MAGPVRARWPWVRQKHLDRLCGEFDFANDANRLACKQGEPRADRIGTASERVEKGKAVHRLWNRTPRSNVPHRRLAFRYCAPKTVNAAVGDQADHAFAGVGFAMLTDVGAMVNVARATTGQVAALVGLGDAAWPSCSPLSHRGSWSSNLMDGELAPVSKLGATGMARASGPSIRQRNCRPGMRRSRC